MATYATVETALAKLYRANSEVQRGAFRARIKHFMRVGLPLGPRPGKGKRVDYDIEQIWQLLLAFELTELGVDPVRISQFLQHHWHETICVGIRAIVRQDAVAPSILVLVPNGMSSCWTPDLEPIGISQAGAWVTPIELKSLRIDGETRRRFIINVGQRLEQLDGYLRDEPLREPSKSPICLRKNC